MTNMPDPETLSHAAELAFRICREAGDLAMSMGSSFDVSFKSERDLVTSADVAAEKLLIEAIQSEFPDHRIYGEEGGRGAETGDWRWLLDPIDGTTNYAHHYPAWCVSVCLEYCGRPVVGAIYNPPRNEFFFAVEGRGATLNGEPIHVSAVDKLIQSVVTFELSLSQSDPAAAVRTYHEARRSVQGIRINGSAALSLCDVACGRTDGYWQRHLCHYDIGAGVILVREAGGDVTSFDGSAFRLEGSEVCSSNHMLHDEILAFIAKTDPVSPPPQKDEHDAPNA